MLYSSWIASSEILVSNASVKDGAVWRLSVGSGRVAEDGFRAGGTGRLGDGTFDRASMIPPCYSERFSEGVATLDYAQILLQLDCWNSGMLGWVVGIWALCVICFGRLATDNDGISALVRIVHGLLRLRFLVAWPELPVTFDLSVSVREKRRGECSLGRVLVDRGDGGSVRGDGDFVWGWGGEVGFVLNGGGCELCEGIGGLCEGKKGEVGFLRGGWVCVLLMMDGGTAKGLGFLPESCIISQQGMRGVGRVSDLGGVRGGRCRLWSLTELDRQLQRVDDHKDTLHFCHELGSQDCTWRQKAKLATPKPSV
ncbi:hypothetical protein Dimus_023378 [Dionaea muscipula]